MANARVPVGRQTNEAVEVGQQTSLASTFVQLKRTVTWLSGSNAG